MLEPNTCEGSSKPSTFAKRVVWSMHDRRLEQGQPRSELGCILLVLLVEENVNHETRVMNGVGRAVSDVVSAPPYL